MSPMGRFRAIWPRWAAALLTTFTENPPMIIRFVKLSYVKLDEQKGEEAFHYESGAGGKGDQ